MPGVLTNGTETFSTGGRVAVDGPQDDTGSGATSDFCELTTSIPGVDPCAPSGGGGGGTTDFVPDEGNEAPLGGLPGNRNPTAIDDLNGELVWQVGETGVIGNLLDNDFDLDGDTIQVSAFVEAEFAGGVFSQIIVSENGDVTFTAIDADTNEPTGNFDHPTTTRFQYTIVDLKGGFDTGEAEINVISPPPEITIAPETGEFLDFVEGGEDLFITVELSKPSDKEIVIRPSHDFLEDLSIQSELVVPAGVTSISIPLGFAKSEIAVGDFSVEAGAESGLIDFEASIDGAPIEIFLGTEIPFVIREEVTNVPPPDVVQKGMDAAAVLRQQLKANADLSKFVTVLDPAIAKELYLDSMSRIAKAVEPAFILNENGQALGANLEAADALLEFGIEDPNEREANQIAYANARYDAFKRSFVDTVDQLTAFAFKTNSAAFATGLISGLAVGGTVASLPVAAAVVIGAVVVGKVAGLTYNASLREFVRDAAGAAFEFDNPRAEYVNATIDELNLVELDPDEPVVSGGDLLPQSEEDTGPQIDASPPAEQGGEPENPTTSDPNVDLSGNDIPILFQKGGAEADRFLGAEMNDTLIGGRGDDTLIGRSGDDSLRGGGGDDRIVGGGGNDQLKGGGGADELMGGARRDDLVGGGGRDNLNGGGGRDALNGGGGADILEGGRGADILTGARGRDVFEFQSGDGRDRITDFRHGEDKISITAGADEFDDLTILQQGEDVLIRFANVRIFAETQEASDFTSQDFLFA